MSFKTIKEKIKKRAGEFFSKLGNVIKPGSQTGNVYDANSNPIKDFGASVASIYNASQQQQQQKENKPKYVPQVYQGSTGSGSNQNYSAANYQTGGSPSSTPKGSNASNSSQGSFQQAPFRFDANTGAVYARSAGLGAINLAGKTQQEADETIGLIKESQRGQNTALTSAVFSPDAPSAVENRIKKLSLSIDSKLNDPWANAGTKREDVDNMLKSTAADLAEQFDSSESIKAAYDTNPTVRNSLDIFGQYGGSDQMIEDAISSKTRAKTPVGMTTDQYLSTIGQPNAEKQKLEATLRGDKIIADEIARESGIQQQYKDAYLGNDGAVQQIINLAKENISLMKEKIADEKASAREKARYYIQKNNEELSLAKNTIEQNRINAKNYMTGMLAKLGALNTTSAAAEGITILEQRYQQQAMDAESRVRLANQDIEIKLSDSINDIENTGNEKIQSIKEDLSKDQATILKEIMKEQNASDKRIYELTLKADERARKNIKEYTDSAKNIADEYTTQFSSLVSSGLDINKAAEAINVKLSAADRKVSESARIKDPNAISFFKTLPNEFKNQWIQFALTQPQGTYFTLADLQMNYEPYVLEQNQEAQDKVTTSTKEREI